MTEEAAQNLGWLPVDPNRFTEYEMKNIDGGDVCMAVSPYDVPDGMRGFIDRAQRHFVIVFRYLGQEPETAFKCQNVTLRIGRNSDRLYGVEVDLDPETQRHWLALVDRALGQWSTRHTPTSTRFSRRFNYEIVKSLLNEKGPQLRASAAP